jgi:predicted MPP superfamily phosphohydrolase
VLGFVGLIIVVIGLVHLYLWKRLVRDPLRPGRWRRIGGAVALLLAILIPATLAGTRSGRAEWLAWPGYIWLALMFYLLVILIALEIPRLASNLWIGRDTRADTETAAASGPITANPTPPEPKPHGRGSQEPAAQQPPAQHPQPGIERRLLLARGTAIFAGLTAAAVTGYGIRTALGPPQLDRVQIPLAKLPRSLDGTRFAVVSDIHLGPLTGSHHVDRIVDKINSMDADVVCVVGDLVDGTVAELGRFARPLADIRSRLGAYFVTGNHEYYSGFQPWVDEVARLGVRPLRNERLELGGLDLAGVNDLGGVQYGDGPDFAKALGDRDPDRPVILLAHQPVVARGAAKYGVDLQLSGHTHGGQMVPFNLLVKLEQPVVSGYGRVDGVPVYVTNGAGFWGPPVRVGAPPQVTLVELRTP